jgi:hypothetical protein
MSELWYRGYKTRGVPKDIVFDMAKEIQRRNLGKHVPKICTEPTNKPGEFYIFSAINSEIIGEPPIEIIEFERWLDLQHIRVFPGAECVLQDEFTKSWLKRFVDITYTRKLTQWMFKNFENSIDNPFDLSEESIPDETARQSYNYLLYWLSAQGDGSWQKFCYACAELNLEKIKEPRFLFRRLRLLGHSEYLDGGRWTICPPCMVEVEKVDERYRYFLAGSRSSKLVDQLTNAREINQARHGAPDAIFVSFESYLEAQSVVAEISKVTGTTLLLAGNSSQKLANLLPNIKDWGQTMLGEIPVFTERYKIMKWDGNDFSQWVDQPNEIGMYRLIDNQFNDKMPDYYYFFDPEGNKWFQGDWYGLRYLANQYLGYPPTFIYDLAAKLLYVPNTHRIPDIYERALILASGELSTSNNNGIIYKNISLNLAELIGTKVNAKIDMR